RLLELGLALLELGNVGEDANGAAVRGAALADAGPNLIVSVFGRAFRVGVVGEALGDPFLRRAPLEVDHPPVDNGAKDGRKGRARTNQSAFFWIERADLAFPQHEPVLRVVKHEAFGNGLDGGRNHTPLTLGLGREPLTLDDALTK